MSQYRCREHPEQETTRRGTGCPDCDADARPTPKPYHDDLEDSFVAMDD